jgi:4-hydroxy-2-oxoheptanedioate aldolase
VTLQFFDQNNDTILGPFDLAKQLGVERKGPEHEAAIQRILKAAHGAGKKAAIFCKSLATTKASYVTDGIISGTEGADAKKRLEQGFDMVSITTDIGTISKGIMQEMADVEGGIVGERNGY